VLAVVVVVVVVAVAVAVAVVGRGLFGYCMIVSCRLEHSMGRQTTGVGLPEGVTYPLERNFLPQFWCSCSPCDDCPIIPLRTKAFLFLFPSFGIVMSVAIESDSPSKREWKTSRLTAFDQWSFFFPVDVCLRTKKTSEKIQTATSSSRTHSAQYQFVVK